MKKLTFRRTSDSPPAEHEMLEIDADGSFAMWRSTGRMVGRFAGVVPDIEALVHDADRALRSSPAGSDRIAMDATLERIDVDGHQAAIAADLTLDGWWGVLLKRCRALMSELCEQPKAAIEIDLDNPSAPRLVHRGTEPLVLELIQPAATVGVWRDRDQTAEYWGYADIIETVSAEHGWQLEIPVPDARPRHGDNVIVEIALDVYHDGVPLRVHVSAVAEIAAPDGGVPPNAV